MKNISLLCFVDNFYLCICDENHNRAECFIYEKNLDQCSSCLTDSQCIKYGSSSSPDFDDETFESRSSITKSIGNFPFKHVI